MNAKIILISIIILLLAIQVRGQLTVDAGNDTTLCLCADTLRLGGNPTATGGKEPYIYKWELKPVYYFDYRIPVSELLNDSTSANPVIECDPFINDTVTFVLTVTDSNSNSAKDSVDVLLSSINSVTLIYLVRFINQGDSAEIYPYNIINGVPPFSYRWTPETGLSNPNIATPFARPDSTTKYYCQVTDALGCNATDFVHVFVNPTEASITRDVKNKSIVYPNPIQKHSIIRFNSFVDDNLIIEVINTNGQIVINDSFNSNSFEIGKRIEKRGLYFYRIKNQGKTLTVGQFMKQ